MNRRCLAGLLPCRKFSATTKTAALPSFSLSSLVSSSPPAFLFSQPFRLSGWVKSVRKSKSVTFVVVQDGVDSVQCAINSEAFKAAEVRPTVGAALRISGLLRKIQGKPEDKEKEEKLEVAVENFEVVGAVPPADYPLGKKAHSLEFLRSIPHLRARASLYAAAFSIRSKAQLAVHDFLSRQRDFLQIAAPVLTPLDCEGGGETFQVFSGPPGDPRGFNRFFGRPVFLSVSGQLYAEMFTNAFSRVYCFGPTFRAETRVTRRHLAEFWMLEPEIAFAGLEEILQLAEQLIKAVIKQIDEGAAKELAILHERRAFLQSEASEGPAAEPRAAHLEELRLFAQQPFKRVSYTEAVEILQGAPPSSSLPPIVWGSDISSEHERFLTDVHFRQPVFVTHYPAKLKPFYMKLTEDGRMAECFDLLWPGIGELAGGSAREESAQRLTERLESGGLNLADYRWYIELRKFGGAPHAGFGIGFERLVAVLTGLSNVRDSIQVPRSPNQAKC